MTEFVGADFGCKGIALAAVLKTGHKTQGRSGETLGGLPLVNRGRKKLGEGVTCPCLMWAVEFEMPLDVLSRGAKWEGESSVDLEGPQGLEIKVGSNFNVDEEGRRVGPDTGSLRSGEGGGSRTGA